MILQKHTPEEVVYLLELLANGRVKARIYFGDSHITLQLPVTDLAHGYELDTICSTIVLTKEEYNKIQSLN